MVTKDDALTANTFHFTMKHACSIHIGPRGRVKHNIIECRRNGKTQVWKRSSERFRVPVKYGLYEYGEITEQNAQYWHTAEDCPLNKGE